MESSSGNEHLVHIGHRFNENRNRSQHSYVEHGIQTKQQLERTERREKKKQHTSDQRIAMKSTCLTLELILMSSDMDRIDSVHLMVVQFRECVWPSERKDIENCWMESELYFQEVAHTHHRPTRMQSTNVVSLIAKLQYFIKD